MIIFINVRKPAVKEFHEFMVNGTGCLEELSYSESIHLISKRRTSLMWEGKVINVIPPCT
ncbi:hypothetical protein [Hungatella hathewayi]|uniref:hypothetical protein n=1 Tax=Hungatella hathewayi TaxID=154046 RepID=UPI0035697072